MTDAADQHDLAALRGEIDRLDDTLHELVMQRAHIVEQIKEAKGPGAIIRPRREADILSRLLSRHDGKFPKGVLVRIWRELLAGTIAMQTDMAIAVVARDGERSWLWDLARDYYGSSTPIKVAATPMHAIRYVTENRATLAVVPWPDENDDNPWWRQLMTADENAVRVVARIPAVDMPDQSDQVAVSVGRIPIDARADDRGMIAMEIDDHVSRSRLRTAFESVGLKPLAMWTGRRTEGGLDTVEHLIYTDGYLADGDAGFDRLEELLAGSLHRRFVVGGFAAPLKI